MKYFFEGNRDTPGYSDDQNVYCPICHKLLGDIRCDVGSPELIKEEDIKKD